MNRFPHQAISTIVKRHYLELPDMLPQEPEKTFYFSKTAAMLRKLYY